MKQKVLRISVVGGVLAVVSSISLTSFSSAQIASSSSSTAILSSSVASTTSQLSSTAISSLSSTDITASSSIVPSSSTQMIEPSTTTLSSSNENASSTVVQSSTFSISSEDSTTLEQSSTPASSPLASSLGIASSSITSPTETLSSAPQNLSAVSVSPSQISLAWNGSANATGIAGYKIYRNGSLLTSLTATSTAGSTYIDSGLTASTTYTYAVASFDSAGNMSSQSAAISATTEPGLPPAPTRNPICDQIIINVPGDYQTIQAAVNAAAAGDTVKVAAGAYNENVTLKSGICLEGAGIDQTIISKAGASGLFGSGMSYVIITNLTVQNSGCAPGVCGGGGDGGGIALYGSTNITISNCRLTGNTAANGGGMLISASSVSIDHCLVDGNTAENVGAGIVAENNSSVTLTAVTVANNQWRNTLKNGGIGGIGSYASTVQVNQSIVWGNNDKNLSASGATASNSDVEGWSGGTNTINSDPDFASADDYRLQSNSPAAGMGLY